jgi:hypothetical protein
MFPVMLAQTPFKREYLENENVPAGQYTVFIDDLELPLAE